MHSTPTRFLPSSLALIFSLLLTVGALLPAARAVDADVLKAQATDAVESWLALVDRGDYAASWDGASGPFKTKVTQAQWAQAAEKAREPLGEFKKRVVASVLLQPAPASIASDAQMVLIQYHSEFDNLASAMETVSLLLEADGKWRAAGYFVRPN